MTKLSCTNCAKIFVGLIVNVIYCYKVNKFKKSKLVLQQKIILKLNKSNARKLHCFALKNDVEVKDLAENMLSSYLKKK